MYLKNTEELGELLDLGERESASHVVLNEKSDGKTTDALPMSTVLSEVLSGPTRSFTALVGWFGHGGDPEEESPAKIILDEAQDDKIDVETDVDAVFRLAVGVNSSADARDASRAWYWLCRYRHEYEDEGREQTDLLREEFLQAAREDFVSASKELLSKLPFSLGAEQFAERLQPNLSLGETTESIREELEKTLYSRASDSSPGDDEPFGEAANVLLGFLLQRKGDFRFNPKSEKGVTRVFHPKMYVVEQEYDTADGKTVSMVGSHNWTQAALGTTGDDGVVSNVEVATIHVDAGHVWNEPSETKSLGHRVCGTAKHLFENSEYILGSWEEPAGDKLLPAHDLAKTTQETNTFRFDTAVGRRRRERGDTRELPRAFAQLIPHLRHLVAELSQVNLEEEHDKFLDRFRLTGDFADRDRLFGGKIPSSYQHDGAVRLLSILEGDGNTSTRGAFLTDEAGLGKTLTAKMSLAIMATSRLVKRRDHDQPLKMSLIVPAALKGAEAHSGRAPTGWNLHAREIREATRTLLADVCDGIDEVEARELTSDDRFEIRVVSHGMFSPRDLPDAERSELSDTEVFDGNESFFDDFEFVASSELVAIDESHTFRNQTSRQTRTLRLLLSLPLPGEKSWPIRTPGGRTNFFDEIPEERFPDDISRRVLCLSATPFNNRIDDIITQIGHFAQYQDWEKPYGTVGQTEFAGEEFQRPLDVGITNWCVSDDAKERSEGFRTILGYARRHLHRTRALTVPPDKEKEKTREGIEELRSRYNDLGPEYIWDGRGHDYVDAFSKALNWLDEHEKAKSGDADVEALERKRYQAQQELEAVLTSLFVQRSRIRALRIIEAGQSTTGEADESANVEDMFRKPRRPRHPLALNLHHRTSEDVRDEDSVEAEILDELFRLLYPPKNKDEEDRVEVEEDAARRALSMRAYQISALRGQRSAQSARNSIGFQVTNLIKRLQSCPYAFFRTLIRGVFRRSISELYLVARALGDDDVQWPEKIDRDALEQNLKLYRKELEGFRKSLKRIVRLIGGQVIKYKEIRLEDLIGATYEDDEESSGDWRELEDNYRQFKEVLARPTERLLWDPEQIDESDDDEQEGWVAALLGDVTSGTDADLWKDIVAVLRWSEELIDQIWGQRAEELGGNPFEEVWREFQSPSNRTDDPVQFWLQPRLQKDERARTLMAWLLVQAVARTQSDDTDTTVSGILRSGSKSLVFTEYKDTQDYLLALFVTLHFAFLRYEGPDELVAELRSFLLDEMGEILRELSRQADQVRKGTASALDYTDPGLYEAPVAGELLDWFQQWRQSVDDDPALFARAVDEMCQTFVRVHGDTADRLIHDNFIEARPGAEDEKLGTSLEYQVDAFSPWYQMEPDATDPGESTGYVERLHQAAAYPVNTMLTTDVLAEGVNLQECGVVIHYDLPWNPTKLIQRNGRIDRRLNTNYEEPGARASLYADILASASKSGDFDADRDYLVPPYEKPEQVYHLTVLPIEPNVLRPGANEDRALASRVRESLETKLEAIRTLFGLSNWPVVLNHEDTQEVLTGELDFETPGFRRREDLFASLRQLEESRVREGYDYIDPSDQIAVHLRAPGSVRERLVRLMTGKDEKLPGSNRIRSMGIVYWTASLPVSNPVRSDADWSSAASSNRGAISGILLLDDEKAAGGMSILTWGVAAYTGGSDQEGRRLLPVLLRPLSGSSNKTKVQATFANLTNLSPLESWAEVDTAAPGTPSELADDIIKVVIDTALDGVTLEREAKQKTPVPANLLPEEMPEHFRRILQDSHLFNVVLGQEDKMKSRKPALGPDGAKFFLSPQNLTLDQQADVGFNLWVSFDR